jgi:hypothetical protein
MKRLGLRQLQPCIDAILCVYRNFQESLRLLDRAVVLIKAANRRFAATI